MNMDVQLLNKIEELAIVIDVDTAEIILANNRLLATFQTQESRDILITRLLKDYDKDETIIRLRNSFYRFKLCMQSDGYVKEMIAFGTHVDQVEKGADKLEADGVASDSYMLFDKIMQIKDNTVSHITDGRHQKGLSNLDALTGLPNKHYFIELTEQIINNESIHDEFAIVYFNIGKFQTFNDTYGFTVGDEFLKSVVKVLMEEFEYYLEARYSDDHFVVLTSRIGLLDKIKRIHERVHTFQKDVVMEIKAGIYEMDKETPVSQACDWAKLACDSIKYNYTEDYRFYDASLREQLIKEKYIIDHIDEAVEKGYLKVYYQPVVRVLSGQVCGMESLVRWIDPRKGFLSPGDFIPILEKHRLISKVDKFVIEQVCKDLVESRKQGCILVPISINLSRLDFQLMDVCKEVNDTVQHYRIDRSLLHLEVTESALNDDAENLYRVIEELKREGYEVWLDDFGSEYSSLNTLQNFQFDVLKIDMKFFATFQTNESSKTIILSIVDMAKRLKMRTVAEGVETKEQFEFLKSLGCDIAQGYYFFRPSPLEELIGNTTQLEQSKERQYFDDLGKINLLSPEPVEHTGDGIEMFSTAPTAIIQLKDGYISYLFTNSRYEDTLRKLGIETMQEAEQHLNDKDSKYSYVLMDLLEQSDRLRKVSTVDFIYNGMHCTINAQKIASTDNARAYFTTLMNMNLVNRESMNLIREETLPYLYNVYNRVDVMDFTEDKIINIYLNVMYYKSNLNGNKVRESLQEFAKNDIIEEDRQKFLHFYNCDTLKERISKSKMGFIVQFIRTKTRDNQYINQLYVIIQAGNNKTERYLSCVRDIQMDMVKDIMDTYSKAK